MASIKTVFTADTAPFKKGLSSIKEDTGKLKGLLATLGVGLSVAGIVAFAKEVAELGEQFKEISEATGIAQDKLQTIVTMGELGGGLKIESVTKNILNMGKFMAEAADPTSKEAALLNKLGLSMQDLISLDSAGQYHKINTAIASMTNSQERLVAVTKVYGKTGKDLAPMLASGADGYAKQMEEANKYIKITSKSTEACDAFNDELHAFSQSILKAGGEVMSPAFTEFAKMLQTLSMRIAALQKDGTLAVWGRQLGKAMEGARRLIENLFTEKNIKTFVGALGQLASTLKTIWNSLGSSFGERLFNAVMLRQSAKILTGTISDAISAGWKTMAKSAQQASGGGIGRVIGTWTAIGAAAYSVYQIIQMINQSVREYDASRVVDSANAVLGEYEQIGDKIKENQRLVDEATAAEARAVESANGLLTKKLDILEEQAASIQKLNDMRDKEQKSAEDAQDAINKGKEKEAELNSQLAEIEQERQDAALDAEYEANKAITEKFKDELEGLDKVSTARLREAAAGKGMSPQTQAEFVHKARMDVARRNLNAGVYDPRFAAETREVAQRGLQARTAQERNKQIDEQRKLQKKATDSKKLGEREQKIKREQVDNYEDMGKNAVKKDDADGKVKSLDKKIAAAEAQYNSAAALLGSFAAQLGNKEAQDRLAAIAAGMAGENMKIAKEQEFFTEHLGDIASAIQTANEVIGKATENKKGVTKNAEEANKDLTELQKKNMAIGAKLSISQYEADTGKKLEPGLAAEIQQNPEAYKRFMQAREEAKQKPKESAEIYGNMGTDITKQINRHKSTTRTAGLNTQVKPPAIPSVADMKDWRHVTANKQVELLTKIAENTETATVVKTDKGRGGAR